MTYAEAIDFLYSLRLFGTKLGLENTFRLAALCGNPHDRLKFIHVAGTNGKGSTCAMLESIYRAGGYRTGFFTSPHLVSFTERIQVNRQPISESDVARITGEIRALIEQSNGNRENPERWEFRPTFFEVVSIMALRYFEEQESEIVLWETGLGGRLDATNIVQPLASIITNVQLDHETWLGKTVAEIATEKAGIIKRGTPVITSARDESALKVIRQTALNLEAPLTEVGQSDREEVLQGGISLAGEHQITNAACALRTVAVLQAIFPVTREAIIGGLRNVSWPGRLQLVRHAGHDVLLDGAHNPEGAKTLKMEIERRFARRNVILILGVFRDKAWEAMCDLLAPLTIRVFLTPLQSDRTADVSELQAYCRKLKPASEINVAKNFSEAMNLALKSGEGRDSRSELVVVAGSLHLVGEAMEYLGISPFAKSERVLNEWTAEKTR
jgi:dihydrofolate synthase/folylpolyglutamate synthase